MCGGHSMTLQINPGDYFGLCIMTIAQHIMHYVLETATSVKQVKFNCKSTCKLAHVVSVLHTPIAIVYSTSHHVTTDAYTVL